MLALYPLIHYWDYKKNFWKIGGGARKLLQENMISKFLNYDEPTRTFIDIPLYTHALNQGVFDVVSDIYMKSFVIVMSAARIIMKALEVIDPVR